MGNEALADDTKGRLEDVVVLVINDFSPMVTGMFRNTLEEGFGAKVLNAGNIGAGKRMIFNLQGLIDVILVNIGNPGQVFALATDIRSSKDEFIKNLPIFMYEANEQLGYGKGFVKHAKTVGINEVFVNKTITGPYNLIDLVKAIEKVTKGRGSDEGATDHL